ncbi:hypothetical protein XENOCAPTIV_016585, partial [Xenoophorus captivus]
LLLSILAVQRLQVNGDPVGFAKKYEDAETLLADSQPDFYGPQFPVEYKEAIGGPLSPEDLPNWPNAPQQHYGHPPQSLEVSQHKWYHKYPPQGLQHQQHDYLPQGPLLPQYQQQHQGPLPQGPVVPQRQQQRHHGPLPQGPVVPQRQQQRHHGPLPQGP